MDFLIFIEYKKILCNNLTKGTATFPANSIKTLANGLEIPLGTRTAVPTVGFSTFKGTIYEISNFDQCRIKYIIQLQTKKKPVVLASSPVPSLPLPSTMLPVPSYTIPSYAPLPSYPTM